MIKPYVDQSLVDEIAEVLDPNQQITLANVLNFRAFFKERISSFHLIPCRVCLSFNRVRIWFIDDKDPHIAVALCNVHSSQFLGHFYYASLKTDDPIPPMEALAVFPLAEEVIKSLIEYDGSLFKHQRLIVVPESKLPITIQLENCNFFLNAKTRESLLKKLLHLSRIKTRYKQEIEILINESTRSYQVERFSFATPWDKIEWYTPKCHSGEISDDAGT